jgi:hypothetical protein
MIAVCALSAALAACHPSRGPAAVDEARMLAADREPGQWMSQGRT